MVQNAKSESGIKNLALMTLLTLATIICLSIALRQIFFVAPVEAKMGFVQKIFYFHVPAAWVMLLALIPIETFSLLYVFTRRAKFDYIAHAALELALLFGFITLVTGPLWGRKAWGVYWAWDVRLTSTLVLILTLLAAKMVRSSGLSQNSGVSQTGTSLPLGKLIAAGLSMLAVINGVFVYVSVDLWRGTHPEKLVTKGGLDPQMKPAFWISVLAFHLLFFVLFTVRRKQLEQEDKIEALWVKANQKI